MEKISFLGQTLLKWQVGASTFLALPEKGARLMNWNVTLGDGTIRDVLYWPELKSLDEFHKVRGGNPILFPFNGRSFDQGEIGFWKTPDGVRRPMPMHGIARQGFFRITRLDEGGFSALLIPDAAAKEAYPFEYEFSVTYRFASVGFFVELSLKNLGRQPIPWSSGHHFYFTVPWSDGSKRADYAVQIPSTKTLKQDPQGKLVPGPTIGQEVSLGNPALIDTFHTGLKSNTARIIETPTGNTLSVRLGTAKIPARDALFVTWTLADDSPFYCVEPWMGPPNAWETKAGLNWVEPGASQTFVVEARLG